MVGFFLNVPAGNTSLPLRGNIIVQRHNITCP